MPLKISELARRSGLSVRALHHYDAIGLLVPSNRTDGGARLYVREDLIRLHRIEALKQLGCPLAEIKNLLDEPSAAPVQLLQRQIDTLQRQAENAQRLSRHLQRLLDLMAGGGDAGDGDWLNTLELMNMYQKHLTPDQVDTMLTTASMKSVDTDWTELIAEVTRAVQDGMPPDCEPAQALSWRWMRKMIDMTNNDPALASRLMALQRAEDRAQEIIGITPALLTWIGEAFAHARCTLFARHLTPQQLAEIRRRQVSTLAHMDQWPSLVAELRSHMLAGTPAQDGAVQEVVRRWQQLFRDSYCGDDGAMEARVREAFMHEPELRLGVGMDADLLTYLQRAHVVSHHVPRGNDGPKPSALLVAMQRAAHQLLEQPRVLDDPLALRVLGDEDVAALHANLDGYRSPMARGLRSSVVVRSRLAEDEWEAAIARGIRQCVILGAGLDTSAYRHLQAPGRVFEVDLPSTQAWKRARLQAAGIEIPASLHYVPVDFETVDLAHGLATAGFDRRQPAFFSWLGVTMYLEPAAVRETLRYIGGCAAGTTLCMEFVVPLHMLPSMMRIAMEQVTATLAQRGEPWKGFFAPEDLITEMQDMGFSRHRLWTPEALNERYLAGRSDGLHIGSGPGRLLVAEV